jgi:hypothetical protein
MSLMNKLIPLAYLLASGSPALPVWAAVRYHEIWVLDQVIYPTPGDKRVLAELVNSHSIDAIVSVLQGHQIQFERRNMRMDPALLPSNLYQQISKLPAGEPFIAPGDDHSVANVIVGHESVPSTGEPNEAALRSNRPH